MSLEPPLLLVCLSKGGLSYKTFTESTYFAINVLSEDQKELSALFATQSEEKFTSTIWSHGHKDVPILKGCLSSFVCKNEKIIDADISKSKYFLSHKQFSELPPPARHLVDMSSYKYSIEGVPALSLIAQLGCPFHCTFCSGRNSPFLRKIRLRSIESVIDEVEIYNSQ